MAEWARRRSRTIVVAAGIVLIPLALLGVQLLIRDEFEENRNLRSTVDAVVEARGNLSGLLTLHLDGETAVRGYVLTGDPDFLEPYAVAMPRREPLLRSIRADVANDARAVAAMQDLERQSAVKAELAALNIADVREGRIASARARIAAGGGKRAMDHIRSDIARLDSIQAARLAAVTAQGQGLRGDLEFTISMLLVAIALMLAGAAALIFRTNKERQDALYRATRLHARQTAMFDGAVDGMLALDGEGNIQRINPSIVRMFGYSEDELLGRHNTELMADPFDLQTSRAWLDRVGTAGEQGAGRRQEFTGRRKDGSIFETEVAISRVSDEGDRRYVAAIRDITEAKRAEAMKNEFVSTVSHELRTPLTSIGGSLGLLSSGAVGKLNDKAARLVEIAHTNCERLIRLINDILDIEKIESGKMHFAEEDIELGALVRRTIAANTAFAEARGIRLELTGADRPLAVVGDADRLEQLLTNLVSNAIKYSPPAGTVDIILGREGIWAVIEVCDRGAGIPAEFRGRIFGKFAMADGSDSRQRGGTGLGLSIAREIAERHGGSVGFRDREGGGTVFRAQLPLLVRERNQAVAASTLPAVLHVDDDRDCLSVTLSAFERRARLVSAGTMDEARAAIARHAFAGAIIDVGLRGEDGTALIPELRARRPDMPIVLFSAIDDQHEDAGADAVLVKSRSTIQDLVETMCSLIDESEGDPR